MAAAIGVEARGQSMRREHFEQCAERRSGPFGLMMPAAPDINARKPDGHARGAQRRSCCDRSSQRAKGWASKFDPLDPGAAILRTGRPTLVVPKEVSSLSLEHAVIGWKDNYEEFENP
jgi:hypothetical protein